MEQIKGLVAGLTLIQRISIVAAVAVAGVMIGILLHYRHEGDFRPLYTSMAPEDAAAVVQKLKESGVEYRLSDGGSVVMVASTRLAESRLTLASAGLPKSGRIGFELFDKTNFGATELVEHVNYQRALEGELERSVMSMAEVVQARVHLTFPRESVFLDQQQPAKASVMVKLRPGARISAQNVAAVSQLVASAVGGLNPEAVAVLDMDGNLLSRPRRFSAGDSQTTTDALEVRQQIEKDLVAKISTTLEPLLGPEQFRAGASVDCDLTSGEQQEETYNPDQSVMVASQKSEDQNDRAAAGGIPGTASNLPNPPAKSAGTGGVSHRTENVTYQTSRTIKHTRIPQGVIRRMSLSVLVGQPAHFEGTGKARHRVVVPPSPETLKTIRDVVAAATGFNAERGDQMVVETLPFESGVMETGLNEPPAGSSKVAPLPPWLEFVTRYRDALNLAVGVLVLLGVLTGVALKLVKRKPNRPATPDAPDQLEAAAARAAESRIAEAGGTALPAGQLTAQAFAEVHEQTMQRVRNLAQRDAALTANVLRVWLQEQKG